MKLRLPVCSPVMGLAVAIALTLTSVEPADGEESSYVSPTFSQGVRNAGAMMPPYPASPLAGGQAAAQGGQFMDAQGRPIVMPAGYCASCPGGGGYGYCDSCPGGMGGYGDPMAVDFGGYGEDQCGPHYFDIALGTVFLQADELFGDVGPLASITVGPAAPRILDPADSLGDYEAGWEIAARLDLGALSVIEATYMGIYDIGFSNVVRSLDVTTMPPNQDFQLFTVFSNFGVPTPLDGVDDGSVYTLRYESDLQSTEISYRRYWVAHNPRISGTYLLGARYLRLTEDLNFDIIALAGNSSRSWNSENDLVGFQFGGDGWFCLRQGLRVGAESKAGVYNNRFKFRHAGDFPNVGTSPADFTATAQGNQVAFAAESKMMIVADILPSWSIRGGYQVLYLNSLVTAGNNIDPTNISSTVVTTEDDALYHGFHGGVEYIW